MELIKLRACLSLILVADEKKDYKNRNFLILSALLLSDKCGFMSGIRFDPKEPEWPVAFIELPTGQVSWHLPQHGMVWDGHTTEEKYGRILKFIGG